jgi:hypothetical protein
LGGSSEKCLHMHESPVEKTPIQNAFWRNRHAHSLKANKLVYNHVDPIKK